METNERILKEVEPSRIVDGMREWDIPGWDGYAIREDNTVWSYKKANGHPVPHMLSQQGDVTHRNSPRVQLCCENRRRRYSVNMLSLLIRYGVPAEKWGEIKKNAVLHEGRLMRRKEYMRMKMDECRKGQAGEWQEDHANDILTLTIEGCMQQRTAMQHKNKEQLLRWMASNEETALLKFVPRKSGWGAEKYRVFHDFYLLICGELADNVAERNHIYPNILGYASQLAAKKAKEMRRETRISETIAYKNGL